MAGAGGNEDDIIFADLVTGVSNEILQVSPAAEKKFVKLVAVEGYIVFRVTGTVSYTHLDVYKRQVSGCLPVIRLWTTRHLRILLAVIPSRLMNLWRFPRKKEIYGANDGLFHSSVYPDILRKVLVYMDFHVQHLLRNRFWN